MTYEERRLSCSKHKHSWALDSCINLNILQTPFIWKSYVQLWNRPFKQPCYQTEHLQVVPTKNIFSSNFSFSSLAEWQSQTFPFCPLDSPECLTVPGLSVSKEHLSLTFMRNLFSMFKLLQGWEGRGKKFYISLLGIILQSIRLVQNLCVNPFASSIFLTFHLQWVDRSCLFFLLCLCHHPDFLSPLSSEFTKTYLKETVQLGPVPTHNSNTVVSMCLYRSRSAGDSALKDGGQAQRAAHISGAEKLHNLI